MGRTRLPRPVSGFSLPFVLIAAAILLIGGLTLALRSSDGLLSVLLQAESSDAHDAAETGITRIVGELNRPRNRGLLVKDGSAQDPDHYLWTRGDAEASRNPCLPLPITPPEGEDPDAPDLTGSAIDPENPPHLLHPDVLPNASIGFRETNTPGYSTVYLNQAGQVVTDPAGAIKSYRLLAVRRQPMRAADDRPSLRLFDADGRGRVVLTVEGSALRHGRVVSTVRLEEELELVPKCCDVSFGGAHGNTRYEPDPEDQGRSVCVPDSWGFVAGMATDGTGALRINGATTILTEASTTVDPLLCIAAAPDDCTFDDKTRDFNLELVPPSVVREVRTNPSVAATVMGSLAPDTVPQPYPSTTAAKPFLFCSVAAATTPASLKKCPDDRVTINAAAAAGDLPVHCREGNYGQDENPEAESALHCNLSQLDYSGLDIEVEGTQARALRLYFPRSGAVVSSSGNGTLVHDVPAGGKAGRFALFGCRQGQSGCGDQTINLTGGAEGLNLFAWFPLGMVTVSGNPAYSGELWANTIVSKGGVAWTVPSPEVLAALRLAGYGLTGDLNPPVFDWVARSVRSFRWLGL